MTDSSLSTPGSSTLRLSARTDVHDGLITAFSDVLTYARHQGSLVVADPVTAVHEFRKSVRRARSLVRFCEGWLPRERARSLHRQLKAAFEPTSVLRDGDVLGPTLIALLKGQPDDVLEAGATVLAALESAGAARVVSASAVDVLRVSVETLAGVEDAFAAALPPELGAVDVAEALAARYSATWRSRAGAAHPADLEAVHDWRKRTKELRYALELLSEGLNDEGRQAHQGCARLAKSLGDLADLLALRVFLSVKRPGVRKRQRRLLRGTAASAVEQGRDAALAATEELFRVSPEAFAGRFDGGVATA